MTSDVEENSRRFRKWTTIAVLTALLAVVLAWAFRPRPVPVDTVLVKNGMFEKQVVEDGLVRIKDKFVVNAPADGIVPRIELEPGDRVKKDQVLFRFLFDIDLPVHAPAEGVVLDVFRKDRQHVLRGTPILSIGDPHDLEIVSDVLTEEAVEMRPGQDVRIVGWGEDRPLAGTIKRIEPSAFTKVSALGVNEQRVNVIIAITSLRKEWRELGDGYHVELQFILSRRPNALLVPTGALFENSKGMAVFVTDGKRAELRQVRLGPRGPLESVVEEGLSSGERVINYPGNEVADGVSVDIRRT